MLPEGVYSNGWKIYLKGIKMETIGKQYIFLCLTSAKLHTAKEKWDNNRRRKYFGGHMKLFYKTWFISRSNGGMGVTLLIWTILFLWDWNKEGCSIGLVQQCMSEETIIEICVNMKMRYYKLRAVIYAGIYFMEGSIWMIWP